jgi:hypothetical protein
MVNTERNLKCDIKKARELIRSAENKEKLALLVEVGERTLRRIAADEDYPITAKTLYAILKYGPALQKSNKETA